MNSIINKIKFSGLLICILAVSVSCEREVSEDAVPATFPTFPDVYTDNPVGLTDQFFESFDPAIGANTEAFGTDDDVSFMGTSSIRLDIPAPNDPNGGFIGGIFKDRGEGRDLSGYDALTFWMKASRTALFDEIGFGPDFEENKFAATRRNIPLSTDWRKVIIPIPDPSKLVQEKGLFLFSTGTASTDGVGFTVWIDEIRYEKLGTSLLVESQILDGNDEVLEGFIGSTRQIGGLTCVFNIEDGSNVNVNASASYYNFFSSDPNVASVDENGFVTVIGDAGTSTVTASLGNEQCASQLTVTSNGPFPQAPIPTQPASNVVSLFSDAYTNVPVRHYNGYFLPYQTTEGGAGADPNNVDIQVNLPGGAVDNIINYTQLNFVSIGMYETVPLVDISAMTTLHVDINVREVVQNSDFIRLSMESGTGVGQTQAANFQITGAMLTDPNNVDENGWFSMDIPISSFAGSIDLTNLGQLFFISDATVSDIWVDNVYFFN